MLSYWFVAWLALASVLLAQAVSSAATSGTPGAEFLVAWTLVLMPVFRSIAEKIPWSDGFRPILRRFGVFAHSAAFLALAVAFYKLGLSLGAGVLALLLVAVTFLGLDARVPFLFAVTFLAFVPLFLATGMPAEAESFSVLAYYLLTIGIAGEVFKSVTDKYRNDERNA